VIEMRATTSNPKKPIDSAEIKEQSIWSRRAITLPLVILAFCVGTAFFPVGLFGCFLHDLIRRRFAFPAVRGTLFLLLFLGSQVWAITCAFLIYLKKILVRPSETEWWRWNRQLQDLWTRFLYHSAKSIFSLQFEVENDRSFQNPPFVLFVRHTSIVDTLFPAIFVSIPSRVPLRYILKAELLWDPCLDIVGRRIPNCFVSRGRSETDEGITKISTMAKDLPPNEGIIIFPEGTRATPKKRAALLSQAEQTKNTALYETIQTLKHILPLRRSGVMALLENTSCDLVYCAHTGFEGISTLAHIWDGSFVGRHIHVKIWRQVRATLPEDLEAQWASVQTSWEEVDAFVGQHRAPSAGIHAPRLAQNGNPEIDSVGPRDRLLRD
jgi:1-acyl-sn-glycerol-3-phosphate acyltransferase